MFSPIKIIVYYQNIQIIAIIHLLWLHAFLVFTHIDILDLQE